MCWRPANLIPDRGRQQSDTSGGVEKASKSEKIMDFPGFCVIFKYQVDVAGPGHWVTNDRLLSAYEFKNCVAILKILSLLIITNLLVIIYLKELISILLPLLKSILGFHFSLNRAFLYWDILLYFHFFFSLFPKMLKKDPSCDAIWIFFDFFSKNLVYFFK